MASEIKILEMLKLLGDLYPSYELVSAAVGRYVELLAEFPGEVLEQAVELVISRLTFFPTVAELRIASFEILEAAHPFPNEFEAWAELRAQFVSVGHNGTPKFTHPLIEQVMEQFGWWYLCVSEESNIDRAHFLKAYRETVERLRAETRYPPKVKAFIAGLQDGSLPQLAEGQEECPPELPAGDIC